MCLAALASGALRKRNEDDPDLAQGLQLPGPAAGTLATFEGHKWAWRAAKSTLERRSVTKCSTWRKQKRIPAAVPGLLVRPRKRGVSRKQIPVDKLTKDGPTKVLGRLVATSEKAVTFDGRKWRCVEPTRDERLTIACYTPCGIRHARKGTRRTLKRLGFVLPRRRNSLLGSAPGIRTVPAMPCIEASVTEHNERIAKEEEEILDAILSRLALVFKTGW